MLGKVLAAAGLLLTTLPGCAAQQARSAEDIPQEAKNRAEQQHKLIFLVFSASWCGPCHALERFIKAPDVAPILEQYFVFAKVHIDEQNGQHPELNTPGGKEMMAEFGGPQGVPYIVIFNANGEPLVTSSRPLAGHKNGDNIGYPNLPEEIDWFVQCSSRAFRE